MSPFPVMFQPSFNRRVLKGKLGTRRALKGHLGTRTLEGHLGTGGTRALEGHLGTWVLKAFVHLDT